MKSKFERALTASLAGIGLVVVLFLVFMALSLGRPAQAAPPAAPTPVANIVTGGDGQFFVLQPATAIAVDTNTNGPDVLRFDSLDVQYVIDHGTTNTTTLTIQYSNDGSNWVNGVALVTDSAVDGSDITRVPVFGRYMRVNQNVSTPDMVTITVNAVGR
jgi:hypothetical protein